MWGEHVRLIRGIEPKLIMSTENRGPRAIVALCDVGETPRERLFGRW